MITTRVPEAAEQHHIRCHHITKAIYIAIFNDRHIIPNITCAVPTCRLQSPICDSWKSRHLHFSPFLRTSPWRSVAICSWNIHMVWDKPQMCHSQPKKKQSGTLRYSNPSATAAFYMTVTSKLPIHKGVPNESPHVMRDFPIETQ